MPVVTTAVRRSRGLRLAVLAVLASGIAIPMSASAAKASPCADGNGKCYSLSISASPAQPQTGQSATYTGRVSNLSDGGAGHQLGAVNITWSPTGSFTSVTPGSVSPAGQESVAGGAVRLRNLDLAPGASATFTFTATAAQAGTITFTSAAKQSNDFNGTGNDLTLAGGSPSVQVVAPPPPSPCAQQTSYNAYGCKGFLKTQGATISTGATDSAGAPSLVTAELTVPAVTPAVGSSATQVMAVRSYLGGDTCPAVRSCTFSVQLLNKLDVEYDAAHGATLAITCGSLCSATTVWFQQEESTGTTEALPPCTPLGPVASPLTGSLACYDLNLSGGGITVHNVTHVNDWKVMT